MNVQGYIALVRSAVLNLRPGDRIIALTSSLAQRVGIVGAADYAGTNAAVLGYTKGVRQRPRRPQDHCECGLGWHLEVRDPKTRKGHLSGFYAQEDIYEEAVTTDDVVRAVMFLVSPSAGSITRKALDVTGGELA